MKRSKTVSFRCGHARADGVACDEFGHYSYDNREEGVRLQTRYGGGQWRCMRHSRPEEVLTPDNRAREVTFVLGPDTKGRAPGLYWHPQGVPGIVSGFASGTGWKAFAEDWPAGTVIRVRVDVEAP